MRNFIKSNIIALFALFLAGGAVAGVLAANRPTLEGRNTVFGDVAATGTVDIPTYASVRGVVVGPDVAAVALGSGGATPFVGTVVFLEADDTAAYTGPTANAALNTGEEACDVIGMDCAGLWTVTTGTDADLAVVAACTTVVADGSQNLVFCY